MDFQKYFPVWDKLTAAQQERLKNAVTPFEGKKGTILHNGDIDCIGLLLIKSGQLRARLYHFPPADGHRRQL